MDGTTLTLYDVSRNDRGNYTININHETGIYYYTIQLYIAGMLYCFIMSIYVNVVGTNYDLVGINFSILNFGAIFFIHCN